MGYAVAVEEFDRRALLYRDDVRYEHETLLVDRDGLGRRRKCLARDGFHVDNGFSLDAGNLAVNGASEGRRAACGEDGECCQSGAFHVLSCW